jgi:hypothetical protein
MTRRRKRLALAAAALGLLALTGLLVFAGLLRSWSDVRRLDPHLAREAFAAERAAAGVGPAYLEITSAGSVLVDRALEQDRPTAVTTLHLLAWDPREENLIRMAIPYWFVDVKTSGPINLGTLASLLVGDWQGVGLAVSADDLRRRGPGLVLDHELDGGARILLRSE